MKGLGRRRRGGASGVPTVASRVARIAAELVRNRSAGRSLPGQGDIARKKAVTLPKLKFLGTKDEGDDNGA